MIDQITLAEAGDKYPLYPDTLDHNSISHALHGLVDLENFITYPNLLFEQYEYTIWRFGDFVVGILNGKALASKGTVGQDGELDKFNILFHSTLTHNPEDFKVTLIELLPTAILMQLADTEYAISLDSIESMIRDNPSTWDKAPSRKNIIETGLSELATKIFQISNGKITLTLNNDQTYFVFNFTAVEKTSELSDTNIIENYLPQFSTFIESIINTGREFITRYELHKEFRGDILTRLLPLYNRSEDNEHRIVGANSTIGYFIYNKRERANGKLTTTQQRIILANQISNDQEYTIPGEVFQISETGISVSEMLAQDGSELIIKSGNVQFHFVEVNHYGHKTPFLITSSQLEYLKPSLNGTGKNLIKGLLTSLKHFGIWPEQEA